MNYIDSEVNDIFNNLNSIIKSFQSTLDLTKTLYHASTNKSGLIENFRTQLITLTTKMTEENEKLLTLIPEKMKPNFITDISGSFVCNNSDMTDVDYDKTPADDKKVTKRQKIMDEFIEMDIADLIETLKDRQIFPSFNIQSMEDLISSRSNSECENSPTVDSRDNLTCQCDHFISEQIKQLMERDIDREPFLQDSSLLKTIVTDSSSESEEDENKENKKGTTKGRDCLQRLLNDLDNDKIFKKFHKKSPASSSASSESSSESEKEEGDGSLKEKRTRQKANKKNSSKDSESEVSSASNEFSISGRSLRETRRGLKIPSDLPFSADEMDASASSSGIETSKKSSVKSHSASASIKDKTTYVGFNLKGLDKSTSAPKENERVAKESPEKMETQGTPKGKSKNNKIQEKLETDKEESSISFKALHKGKGKKNDLESKTAKESKPKSTPTPTGRRTRNSANVVVIQTSSSSDSSSEEESGDHLEQDQQKVDEEDYQLDGFKLPKGKLKSDQRSKGADTERKEEMEILEINDEDIDDELILPVDNKKKKNQMQNNKEKKKSLIGSSETDSEMEDEKKAKSSNTENESEGQDSNQEEEEEKKTKESTSTVKSKRITRSKKRLTSNKLSDLDKDGKKKKRRRVQIEESEGEDGSGDEDPGSDEKGRRRIRKIMSENKISDLTKQAEIEERERKKRLEERQKLYNKFEQKSVEISEEESLVLERDTKTKEPLVKVHDEIFCKLKKHQIEAIRFLYDCVVESIEQYKRGHSEGAVLAHCMGLGKTLTTITFLHTLMQYDQYFKMHSVMVLCPVNTVLNWTNEFRLWVPESAPLYIYELVNQSTQIKDRIHIISNWKKTGGVLVIGYEMFRNLLTVSMKRLRSKELREKLVQGLLDPGPDMVVCDEGHLLKNDKSHLSKSVNEITTKKRIVLTGTPLQNNLVEYWTMINFVKPNLLGTLKEFSNRFSNPIKNGQHSNSTEHDVKLMKKRAHILYKTLDGCVQRKDYHCLTNILPPRYEYIIKCRLNEKQRKIYSNYLSVRPNCNGLRATLFVDFQNLYRIYSHPYCLKMNKLKSIRKSLWEDESEEEEEGMSDESIEEEEEEISVDDSDSDDGDDADTKREKVIDEAELKRRLGNDVHEISSGDSSDDVDILLENRRVHKRTRSRKEEPAKENIPKVDKHTEAWWEDVYGENDDYNIEIGGKLDLLFRILKECCNIGDKVVIFSHSLFSLDLIEHFLYFIDLQWRHDNGLSHDVCMETAPNVVRTMKETATYPVPHDKIDFSNYYSDSMNTWVQGEDYERIDGSVNAQTRKDYQVRFNKHSEQRFRLFLISTKAGGLGINLTGANRMIIFDVSWNPSHDIQSIFRCYRFGQTKPVYIYRLIAQGTMEEKIYDRQVTKQSLALRVVDEQQIDRHFSENDLQELYSFEPDIFNADNPPETPILPKDRLLAELLRSNMNIISSYHIHDSLLENREDEGLTEVERQEAWKEFEHERKYGATPKLINPISNNNNPTLEPNQDQQQQQRLKLQTDWNARQQQLLVLMHQRNNLVNLIKSSNQNPFITNMSLQTSLLNNNLTILNRQIQEIQNELMNRATIQHHQSKSNDPFAKMYTQTTLPVVSNKLPIPNLQTFGNGSQYNPQSLAKLSKTPSTNLVGKYKIMFDQLRNSRPDLSPSQLDQLTMSLLEKTNTGIANNTTNPVLSNKIPILPATTTHPTTTGANINSANVAVPSTASSSLEQGGSKK